MNIRKLIEEELNNILKEEAEPGTEQNPLPNVAAFHDYIGKLTPEQLANKAIYYRYTPNEIYVSIYNKLGKQIAVVPPEKYEEYAGQKQLASQSMKRREYTECDLAEFIQEKIKTKIRITNPLLLKKLSDRKMGFVTATIANFLLNRAKQKGAKINLQPIQISAAGFRKACTPDPQIIEEYKKIFELFSPEEIEQITQQATSGQKPQDKDKGTRNKPFDNKDEWLQWVNNTTYNDRIGKEVYYKDSTSKPGKVYLQKIVYDANGNSNPAGAEQIQESKSLRSKILKELLAIL